MFTDSSSEQSVAVFYDILKIPKVNTEVGFIYQEISVVRNKISFKGMGHCLHACNFLKK